MLLLRSLTFALVFYLNAAVFLILGSPLLLGPRKWAMLGLKAHAQASLWWLKVICNIRMDVRGRENLPDGAALVVSKHQSAWDTFALIPIFKDPAMVMKAELGLIPLYGWFSYKFAHILVRRARGPAALRKMLKDAKARANQGRQIVIFPEGTRKAPGALPDYKPGALALYEALDVPCVPIAVNSGLYWPRRQMMRYPGTIVVEILPPIQPGLARAEFKEKLITTIETASHRLIDEAAASSSPPPPSGATPP